MSHAMPVARTLRPLHEEEAQLVEAERVRHRRAMTPSKQGLLYFVLHAAVAAGLAVLITGLRAPIVGAVVFVGATIVAVFEHVTTARKMARTPTAWDAPEGTTWQIEELLVLATRVVEVQDARDANVRWVLFRTLPEACFVIPKHELCTEGLAPITSLEPLAHDRVVIRRLYPRGRTLPLSASGALIPARAFSRDEGTWSPSGSLAPGLIEVRMEKLPEWLLSALA